MPSYAATLAALRRCHAQRHALYTGDGGLAEVYGLPNGRTVCVECWSAGGVVLWLPTAARSVPELVEVIRTEAHGHATTSPR